MLVLVTRVGVAGALVALTPLLTAGVVVVAGVRFEYRLLVSVVVGLSTVSDVS